ncbi:MAG TPA: NAD-dependent epimerase/dehydratase family protein [Nitrososphaerales archaeon]|nr:NAD-dependent epimerase/dehydratase family protein [Nitrososphaerales archaeon]
MGETNNKRILITGVAGFLGSNLAKNLAESGADVTGADTPSALASSNLSELAPAVSLNTADVTDYVSLTKLGSKFDCIIHLAALAAPKKCDDNPSLAFEINVHGTHNVLKFALETNATRFVFPSTAHVYGISPKYIPTDENHPLALQNTYTTSKILGESLCKLFYSNHGLSYATLRLFNVYGPGQTQDYFVPSMIIKAKQGFIMLRGSEVTKDFVYVSDMTDAFEKAIGSDYVGEINVGTGIQTKLETVARYIANVIGAKFGVDDDAVDGPTFMQCDPSRAIRMLHWRPRVPLERGLDTTINWFKARST